VIVSGRRGGKTTGAAILSAEGFIHGHRILYAAPTQEQTNAYWRAIKQYFSEATISRHVYKNETERVLQCGNGFLRAKTAWNADTLRGDYADLLFLDEFSLMDRSAWDAVGAPMLLDNDGDAVFIFTPKRRNHAYQIYQQALQDDSGRWSAWHFTSYDNPYLPRKALDEIIKDMTEPNYRQEILAEFLEDEGAVFRNITACLHAPAESDPEQHRGHYIVAGVDWAKQLDYTAISVGCQDCHLELARDRFNQIDYHFQRERLKALADKWHIQDILVERNSIGEPNLEELIRDGLPARGFETTASSKPPLIENLALALDKAEWQFQSDIIWTSELESYERRINPATGRSTYSAPEGLHDDTVIARALMLRAAGGRISLVDNPFDL